MKNINIRYSCLLLIATIGSMGISRPSIAQTTIGTEPMRITAGTETSFDGLALIPDKDIELKDNLLERTERAIQWPVFKSINAVYQFKNPFSFSGELGVYADNGILNGNALKNLKVAFSGVGSNNYNDFSIFSNSMVNSNLVLGRLSSPYPIGAVTAVSRESVLTELVKPENFFTPNGDGINDKWVIQDIQLYPGNVVTVFDRAGRTVFQMSDYNNSWDGYFNGGLLTKGTYFYNIRLSKDIPPVKGFITIVQ